MAERRPSAGVAKDRSEKPARRSTTAVNWDAKIEQEIRAKSREELAALVCSLTKRFPELHQEFRERIALREGDVTRLVEEARAEIREVTSETVWRNKWTREGHTPDYSRIRHRFERLLELGHADEVVFLGEDLIQLGLRQVGNSDDEGETAWALGRCLPLVFQAVGCSSLSAPERLLFAIDARLADNYDIVGEASATILDVGYQAEDWSAVADALILRLQVIPVADEGPTGDFSRKYHRDRVANWAVHAMRESGREGEVLALYESETRVTGSYERLVKLLMEQGRLDDADRWAREGIATVGRTYPGIATTLLGTVREVAEKREKWDVIAAHAAYGFFESPSPAGFDFLVKAAGKAKVEAPVRAAALHFLETGSKPYQVTSPPSPTMTRAPARASAARKATATGPKSASSASSPAPSARLTIDPSWPLPVPDYLVPLLERRGGYAMAPLAHFEVLLEMAIAANRPDEVLHWYKKMGRKHGPFDHYADRTAAAVATSHPERAIAIYREALEAHLPQADQRAYESATGYLRKLRPIYQSLEREGEWTALVASIRDKYRNRPRFMELLDALEGRAIVPSVRPRRK